MQQVSSKRIPAAAAVVAAIVAACAPAGPGTSIKIALGYDDAIGLDTADVTLGDRTQSARIAHQLLLLVPDELASAEIAVEVWGRKAGKRAAYGTTTAVPQRGNTVSAALTLTGCTPGCQNDDLITCTGATVSCALGCAPDGDAHCIAPVPSNGIDPTSADALGGTTTIPGPGVTTFNTDTGAITGLLDRQPVVGVDGGIGYLQAPPLAAAGAPLGIFVFHSLTIDATSIVVFKGTRAAVLLVGDAARIAGVIDVAAGRGSRSAPGAGGGAGADAGPAQGCGRGGAGATSAKVDGGGGGAGAGTMGGTGGAMSPVLHGVGGAACMPMLLEPLEGGSGGGSGGPGAAATGAAGGGGGGALQITALGSLEITGTIDAGGEGGAGGVSATTDGGAGGGGGSGGAVLLEAPSVMIDAGAIVVANGGGGGGGGGTVAGSPGSHGGTSTTPAMGGNGSESSNTGGAGGSIAPPDVGADGISDGGGGGGAAGVIVIRGRLRTLAGTISPKPNEAELKPPG
jgi:hypothetical protein